MNVNRVFQVLLITGLFGNLVLLTSFREHSNNDVLKLKSLVIVDEYGNERITLGSDNLNNKRSSKSSFSGLSILDASGNKLIQIGQEYLQEKSSNQTSNIGIKLCDEKGIERTQYQIISKANSIKSSLEFNHGEGFQSLVLGSDYKGNCGIYASSMEDFLFMGFKRCDSIIDSGYYKSN